MPSMAQMKWNSTFQKYIDTYKDLAVEEMHRYGIPASITLAQGIFESGAGQSDLARNGNNHFGIKCHGWQGRKVYHDDDARGECFRAYDNVRQSYEDHCLFLTQSQRYKPLFSLKITDYKGWAEGLKKAGYATNPQYAQRLIDLIQLYRLYEYDEVKRYDHFIADHTGKSDLVIRAYNKNYYVISRQGDTFKSIAQAMGTTEKRLASINERDRKDKISEGEIIWLLKKQKKAPKDYKKRPHTVRVGESMYSIAQLYGIRLKNLYKMNKLKPEDSIHVGQQLKVR